MVVWGTGQATREFLYVQDAADAIVAAAEKYDAADPINLGSGEEISIRDLAAIICGMMAYEGEIEWDHSKPDGQPRRSLDTSRARDLLGWQARVPLREGLERTIDWYLQKQNAMPRPAVRA